MNPSIQTYHYIARNRKQLTCSFNEDAIFFTVQGKKSLAKEHIFRYTDIDKIHLGLSDISWHTIDIYFRDKTHIHLKSVTFFIEKDDGKLRRPKTNEADNAVVKENQRNYREFVVGLHERVGSPDVAKPIRFTSGNPWKKIIIWMSLLALSVWIPITWKMGHYRWSLIFGSAFLFLFLFNRKINFKKRYLPDDIPQKYLPPFFSENHITKSTNEYTA